MLQKYRELVSPSPSSEPRSHAYGVFATSDATGSDESEVEDSVMLMISEQFCPAPANHIEYTPEDEAIAVTLSEGIVRWTSYDGGQHQIGEKDKQVSLEIQSALSSSSGLLVILLDRGGEPKRVVLFKAD